MQQRKNQFGSIAFNRRSQTWRLFVYDAHGKRRTKTIGTRREITTKTAARLAAQPLIAELIKPTRETATAITVSQVAAKYRAERMPIRYTTRRSYEVWLRCYVLPRWGAVPIEDVQPRPVELWLASLKLSARSKSDIRALLGRLWDCAQWSGDVAITRNPMTLVRVPGASKRTRKPRSVTADGFQKMLAELAEPFRTIALVSACFGLRISECLGLRWSDVDWLNNKLSIQRSIVRQRVGECKTVNSEQSLFISPEMLEVLKTWRQSTQFAADTDWIFASPARIGRLPWCADSVNRAYQKAAQAAGIGHVSTHSMRHSFRSWLQVVGTPVAVQQKLMRHADIRTTMNIYGETFQPEIAEAASKVARLAVPSNSTHQQHTQ